jgi:DNA polymerase I-like protein with 3'-5' exonuclease and polymerase domains
MRLAQNYDLGGKEDEFEWVTDPDEVLEEGDEPTKKRYPLSGLSLVKCARRNLGDAEDHKKEAHDWIYANVPECKKGKAGSYLDRLPKDILERYTVADAITTLRLYEYFTMQFRSLEYDWTFDHGLYMSTTKWVTKSKIRGIKVNREPLNGYKGSVKDEILSIEAEFRTKFEKEIIELEFQKAVDYILAVKTRRGQLKRMRDYLSGKDVKIKFNVGSNKQLAELFVDKLGIVPKFRTDKGSPSFKSAMLSQWGEGGEMLKIRRKRMLVLKQSTSLYYLSADDGRWHAGLRVAAAASGRLAGGG